MQGAISIDIITTTKYVYVAIAHILFSKLLTKKAAFP